MRAAVMFAGVLFAVSLARRPRPRRSSPIPACSASRRQAPKPPKVDWNWRPDDGRRRRREPTVVCGMTVVPADPKVDPKMRVAPRPNGTKYTMTMAPPTVCKP